MVNSQMVLIYMVDYKICVIVSCIMTVGMQRLHATDGNGAIHPKSKCTI